MDGANRSRRRVQERLTRLEEEFSSPEVTQTTFEVDTQRYRRVAKDVSDGRLDIRAVVRDDDGAVLLQEGDGEWMVPHGRPRPDETLRGAVRRIVREAADVECTVTDIARATISGIRNSDDETAQTVYRLSVVFTADVSERATATDEAVRWDTDTAVGKLV